MTLRLDLPFEFEVFGQDEAIDAAMSFMDETEQTPVLLGSRLMAMRYWEERNLLSARELADIERRARALDLEDWRGGVLSSMAQYEFAPQSLGELDADLVGEWPENIAPRTDLESFKEVYDPLVIALTDDGEQPWMAPMIFDFPSWREEEIEPVYLTALSKHWYEQFGAQVIAITDHALEYWVAEPPSEQADCLVLAEEQILLCQDLLQRFSTQSALAAALKDSPIWRLQWD